MKRRKKKLEEVRKERTKICKSLPPFLGHFIQVIRNHIHDREVVLYFLDWMRFNLDCRSRDVLPKLKSNLFDGLDGSKVERENATSEIEQKMNDASFGLEHIFREIGQLYEAIIEQCLPQNISVPYSIETMPDIVSKVLQYGFAFEIMDGDVANIPREWVKAVFKSLVREVGDRKTLVISVLGIQSSGKSTFLNTMFGLQFPVSAGRCTRGIYMQLLPVEKRNALLPFDFILILDTEGIRAPEFGLNTHNRDNELATLALGMADITMINIKGENTAAVNDVLQIAVHAFLRLKLANEKLDLKQSCIFVHQNVSDVYAEEKTLQSRLRLVQTLDEITLSAAVQENIADITSFRQVIDFDYRESVWYIPDLWHGTPPMAHVNLGYTDKVMKIKAAILKNISMKKSRLLSISEICIRMLDIWDGILTDDFVYSFRNSLEVKIYNDMEKHSQRLFWEFEQYTSILYSATLADLDGNDSFEDTNKRVREDFEKKAKEKIETIKDELVKYFDENENSITLNQWKCPKRDFFECFASTIVEKYIRQLRKKHQELQVEVKIQLSHSYYIDEITKKAEHLAKTFTQIGTKADMAQVKNEFDKMWILWSSGIPEPTLEEEDLEGEVTRFLLQRYHRLRIYLQDEISELAISKWSGKETLSEDIDFICEGDIQISIKKLYTRLFKKVSKKEDAKQFTQILFQEIDIEMQKLKSTDTRFEIVHLSSILNKVDTKFRTHNEWSSKELFTFLPPYEAKVLVHVCRYLIYVFQKIHKRYNEKHCPKIQIETFKKNIWTLFVNLVSEKSPEGIAANIFCKQIYSVIKEKLNRLLPLELQTYIFEKFAFSKQQLIIEILKDLADKNDFHKYMLYIADPKLYVMQWLTDQQSFTLMKSKVERKALCMINLFTNTVIESLHLAKYTQSFTVLSSRQLTHTKRNITMLMRRFDTVLKRKEFHIPSYFFREVCKYEIRHEDEFNNIVRKCLKEKTDMFYEEYISNNNCQFTPSVLDNIIENLWGCEETCPFCNEPCTKLKHDRSTKHSCLQHRPLVVDGMVEGENNECMLGSCNFYVQTSKTFHCIASGFECRKSTYCEKKDDTVHKYRRYNRLFPQWDIVPCADASSSQYWCWFVVHFKDELEKYHDLEINNIPSSWKTYNKEDAKHSLKMLVNELFWLN